MAFAFEDGKGTRYLPHFDFDENDECKAHFVPVVEHQKLTGPGLDPGDILGSVSEAVRLAQEKYGESFDELNFNEQSALIEREQPKAFRRLAARRVMGLIRKRPAYRPPVSRVSSRQVRIRAPRRPRHSIAIASRGGGDDGGLGDSDQSDPPRPRLTPVLGTVTFFPSQHRNSKTPWRRRRPGPCRMARYLRPVPRSRHGCIGPP